MTVLTRESVRTSTPPRMLKVVLCGSFRRQQERLVAVHSELAEKFELLSPASVDFVDPSAEFVRLPNEIGATADEIEARHLEAITQADFVWLHAPAGYVGSSASLELGHARALGIPIFGAEAPGDEVLRGIVQVVDSVAEVPERLQASPGSGLAGLQAYYGRTAERRGWASESPTETLLLLTEELGELAREVRRFTGLKRDRAFSGSLGAEIADVQLYLVHLANTVGIDIAEAVTAKEAVNEARFQDRATTSRVVA